ncbi:MAG: hypothetical protein FWB98_03905, partial [Defluviitaleaceae bacterium]|nr:hypothetical protein [Defluviitaleaceae bacterium]
MNKNVMLKTLLRQPLRLLLFVLLVGAVSFAFTVRSAEYVVIDNQIQQISEFFQATGVLRPADGNPAADVSAAADLIAESPLVSLENRGRGFEGLLVDMQNPIIHGDWFWMFVDISYDRAEIDPRFFLETDWDFAEQFDLMYRFLMKDYSGFAGISSAEAFLYGRLLEVNYYLEVEQVVEEPPFGLGWSVHRIRYFSPFVDLVVEVQSSYSGYIDHVPEGSHVILRHYMLDGVSPFTGLSIGEDYFFRANFYYMMGNNQATPYPPFWGVDEPHMRNALFIRPLYGESIWYAPTNGGVIDFSAPQLAHLPQKIQFANHAQQAMHIRTTKDMTTMDRVVDGAIVSVDGRLLNHDDYLEARPVVVVHRDFADRRGLSVGDTVTVTISDQQHVVLDEYYWEFRLHGSLVDTFHELGVLSVPGAEPIHTLELEIVGTFNVHPSPLMTVPFNATPKILYIPNTLLPPDLYISSAPWGEISPNYTPVIWYSF